MLRSAFLKRMALVAVACAFFDAPWPKDQGETVSEVRKSYCFRAYTLPSRVLATARNRTAR
jgi:hypothetical protein